MFKCIIMGDPIPLLRARAGEYRVYDAQKLAKHGYGLQIVNQMRSLPPLVGPLHLDITFYFKMPKSTAKHHDKLRGTGHPFRPDLSNLIKFTEDCAESVELFKNDCQIAYITAKKLWDDVARTEFIFTEIK